MIITILLVNNKFNYISLHYKCQNNNIRFLKEVYSQAIPNFQIADRILFELFYILYHFYCLLGILLLFTIYVRINTHLDF